MTKWGMAIATLFGALIGLGGFTFQYGEGLSYFSKDPAACVNCHIMQSQYDSWQKASHHTSAVCVECHLPNDFVPKWIAKAENGFLHSKAFTFQDFPEPIVIRERSGLILRENCLRCHSTFLHETLQEFEENENTVNCLHCHASSGHGETARLGRFDPAELQAP